MIAHSSDGNRWVEASFSATEEWLTDVAWGTGRFVAVGDGGTTIWPTSTSKPSPWNGERFVAVSYFDGTIMHSSDGDRWEPAREIATFDLLQGRCLG